MASVEDFLARFPEHEDTSGERIQIFLDDAALIMDGPAKWGKMYDMAHVYLAAHYLVVAEHTESGDSGIMAPASKQEVDDVVIESAISSTGFTPKAEDVYSTAYGKRYAQIRAMMLTGIRGV